MRQKNCYNNKMVSLTTCSKIGFFLNTTLKTFWNVTVWSLRRADRKQRSQRKRGEVDVCNFRQHESILWRTVDISSVHAFSGLYQECLADEISLYWLQLKVWLSQLKCSRDYSKRVWLDHWGCFLLGYVMSFVSIDFTCNLQHHFSG